MERMHEYRTRTAAVLDHYRTGGVPVAEVDGVGGVDEVFDRVREAIKTVISGKPASGI
jgi:adenylate kinase family enzyme